MFISTIIPFRTTPRARPRIRRIEGGINPGVELSIARARIFIPYEGLRQTADALHDACDEYETAEREGRLGLEVDE